MFINYDYDDELKKDEFYKRFHPEYLPFVGKNYNKAKVLLCGESNYVDETKLKSNELQLLKSPDWYKTDSSKLTDEGYISWCRNRDIIVAALDGVKSGKSIPKAHYAMYIKPAEVLFDVFPQVGSTWEAYTYFASMNFYQKPAFRTGLSIESTVEDNQFATDNLLYVAEVLKPETIIFLSKKSYYEFKANEGGALKNTFIGACAHPCCAWWNRDNGKFGREAFKTIITNRVSDLP